MEKTTSKDRLNELMRILDLTQADICQKAGIPKSAMSMYVNGKRTPRQDAIAKICDAYNLDPAWLMGYDVPMERKANASEAERDFQLVYKVSLLSPHDREVIEKMIDALASFDKD